jgi:deoxyribose-phosphate aldolase|tara:strand:+ start:205 stop:423 length:219 start_codon:yes stop_codon:yes gene_type:complete
MRNLLKEDGTSGGTTIEDVSIMSQNSGPLKVKASGGIYSKEDVLDMINAGASRIGASAAKEIMLGQETDKGY